MLQPVPGDEVEIVHRQFGEGRDQRLDENRRLVGIDPDGEVIERHLEDIFADSLRLMGIIGQRLRIGDHHELPVVLLDLDAGGQ